MFIILIYQGFRAVLFQLLMTVAGIVCRIRTESHHLVFSLLSEVDFVNLHSNFLWPALPHL